MSNEIFEQQMKKIADILNMDYDGNGDDRLFHPENINTFVNLMDRDEYSQLEKELNDTKQIDRKNYTVYAWNDVSGYDYWHEGGKFQDSNYIQVTAHIKNVNLSSSELKQLENDIDELYWHFSGYDNTEEYFYKLNTGEFDND